MSKVTLYYDIVSPFAYIAFETWLRYLEIWQIKEFHLRPTYLGGVMIASGNRPPMTVARKGAWMSSDLQRIAEYWKVHVLPPPRAENGLPPNTNFLPELLYLMTVRCQHTMRFLRQMQDDKPEALLDSTHAFYEAMFGPNQADVTKPANFAKILQKVKGLDEATIEAIAKASISDTNKERLKTEAKQLVEEQGAFGFPWTQIERQDGEQASFFGADRFELIGHFLNTPWQGPTPSSASKAVAKL